MKTKNFLYLFFSLNLLSIFFKVYHHNKFIYLSYAKQKIDLKQFNTNKEKDLLLVQLYSLKNQSRIVTMAKNELGMVPVSASKIITTTLYTHET